jgi:hypothetical protein
MAMAITERTSAIIPHIVLEDGVLGKPPSVDSVVGPSFDDPQGFEPVRQIAIDEDWSALRFRRTDFIKSMTRDPEHGFQRRARRGRRKDDSGELRTFPGLPGIWERF